MDKPAPVPMPEAQRFWEGCRRHQLWIPYCNRCQDFFFYPRPFCPRCFDWSVDWRQVSGRGQIYAFAVHFRATNPLWADDVPYVTAIVQLEEGVRLFTHLVEVEPDPQQIHSGMPVEVVFEDLSEEVSLPKFRPAASAPGAATEGVPS